MSAVVRKYQEMSFIYNYLLVLILQSTCFICTSWKRKQATEQQPHHVSEQTKSKQKQNEVMSHSNWPRVVLFDLAHRQCSGIIKGWPHCLTSESNGRFLVNYILKFGSAWCLVMAQIQFSLIKKIKTWRPQHSLTLHPSPPPLAPFRLITSYFCQ